MKIRHCKKCGHGFLDDEATTVGPALCDRCKPLVSAETPVPEVTPPPAPPPVAALQLHCPNCGATLKTKIPSRPARGACPSCRLKLVVLPSGAVEPAATFDLAKWKVAAGLSGVRVEDLSGAMKAPEPIPEEETVREVPGPANLGDTIPDEAPAEEAAPPNLGDTIPDEAPPPEEPVAAEPPPPAEEPEPQPKEATSPAAFEETVKTPPVAPPPIERKVLPIAPRDGRADYFLAAALFLIAIVITVLALSFRNTAPLDQEFDRLGNFGKKGLLRLEERLSASPSR